MSETPQGKERQAQRVLAFSPHFPVPRHRPNGEHSNWVLKLRLQQTDLETGLSLAVQRQPEAPGVWLEL